MALMPAPEQDFEPTIRGLADLGVLGGVAEATALSPPESEGDPPLDPVQQQAHARDLIARSAGVVREFMARARDGANIEVGPARAVVSEVAECLAQDPFTLLSMARLKNPEDYTVLHSVSVCALMVALARQLRQPEALVHEAGLGGLLHDIGKAFVPQAVLDRQGELAQDELLSMRTHPERGHALLHRSGGISSDALDICLHHHERVDGSGYPHRLRHAEISLLAKMGAVCDVYDALSSQRPYRSAWDPGESLRAMAQWVGDFDATVFQAFVKAVGMYPVGTLVRLKSGRLAVVVAQNRRALLAPRVKAFYCTRTGERLQPQSVDLARPGCQDRIASCESPRTWPFRNLDRLWTCGDGDL